MNKSSYILILFFLIGAYFPVGQLYSQTQTNLDLIYSLVDESITQIDLSKADGKQVYLDFQSPADYAILKSRVIYSLSSSGKQVAAVNNDSTIRLNYTLDNVKINYPETVSDGLFEGNKTIRTALISGSFYITADNKIISPHPFELTKTDTINFDEIANLENGSIPFTKGETPAEPLFSNLLEPAIAVGAIIVSILLFFTVRSK